MIHRLNTLLSVSTDTNFQPPSGHSVLVTSVGAVVSGGAGVTWNVHAGHSFRIGDKALKINAVGANTFTNAVTAVTATSITWAESQSFAVGDKLINLGPDGGSSTPNLDASKVRIFSNPDGSTVITNSKVSADSTASYEYWYQGNGKAWEVVLDATDDPISVFAGWNDTDHINAVDFGVKMDGTTDDSGALQACIDGIDGGKAQPIYLPDGVCLVSSTVTLTDNIQLRGAGVDQTYIRASASLTSGGVLGPKSAGTRYFFAGAEDLTLDAQSNCDLALDGTSMDSSTWKRVKFTGANVSGCEVQQSAAETATSNSFEQCRFQGNMAWGIHFDGSSANSNRVESCIFRDNGSGGVRIEDSSHNVVRDCIIEGSNAAPQLFGVDIEPGSAATALYNVISGNRFECGTSPTAGVTSHIRVDALCQDTMIIGNAFIGTPNTSEVADEPGVRTHIFPVTGGVGSGSGIDFKVFEETFDLSGGSPVTSASNMSAVGVVIGGSYRVDASDPITGTATGFDVGLTGQTQILANNDTTLTGHVIYKGLTTIEAAATTGVITAVGGTFTGGTVKVAFYVIESRFINP